MGESIEYSITCEHCHRENTLFDEKCFDEMLQCVFCKKSFRNYNLEGNLKNFSNDYFGDDISLHLEKTNIWLDTKNSAIFLGFYSTDGIPNSSKISALCRRKSILGYHYGKGARWEVNAYSLYQYSRILKKQSAGMFTNEAAIQLGISIQEVRKRIHLDKSHPNWIDSEAQNPKSINPRYIVYLNGSL